MIFAWLAVVLAGAPKAVPPEKLAGGALRAVTIPVGEKRLFELPGLDRLTASSGKCIAEGLASDEVLQLSAVCSGMRISFVWLKGGQRVLVLACGEEPSAPEKMKRRAAVQKDLKGLTSVTACVRDGEVQLLGWTSRENKSKVTQLLSRHAELIDRTETVEP